jgi:multimeric flavodoxin WrbA
MPKRPPRGKLRGASHGKVGGGFTSSGTQHGGQETTLFSGPGRSSFYTLA